MIMESHASKVSEVNILFVKVIKSNGRSSKVMEGQRRSWKIMEGHACKVSKVIPRLGRVSNVQEKSSW